MLFKTDFVVYSLQPVVWYGNIQSA